MTGLGFPRLNRRRFLTVTAAAGAGALLGSRATARARRFRWRGAALGAEARILLHADDPTSAQTAIDACLAEVTRLEAEFSLWRGNSALNRLNRDGVLASPSADMQSLMSFARYMSRLSDGHFDVTVQSLWQLYARHFRRRPVSAGPPPAAVEAALAAVDQRRLILRPDRIVLPTGMAVTLNGIAQGYITDRVADILKDRGWTHVLVELGEMRALGARADGAPWQIDVDGPTVPLADAALATSAPSGTVFEASGCHHHLLSPKTGHPVRSWRGVTVAAPSAVLADALSTAIAVSPSERAVDLVRTGGGIEAWLRDAEGRLHKVTG